MWKNCLPGFYHAGTFRIFREFPAPTYAILPQRGKTKLLSTLSGHRELRHAASHGVELAASGLAGRPVDRHRRRGRRLGRLEGFQDRPADVRQASQLRDPDPLDPDVVKAPASSTNAGESASAGESGMPGMLNSPAITTIGTTRSSDMRLLSRDRTIAQYPDVEVFR